MIRPTVFNKVVSELNELRLTLVVQGKQEQDRRDICHLFDIAINAIYSELRAQKKRIEPTKK